MKKIRYILGCVATLLISHHSVHAAAIGMPEYVAKYGFAIDATLTQVDDPRGTSERENSLQPINVIYVREIPLKRWRYWAEAYYHRTRFDAKPGSIGLTAQQLGASLSLQQALDLSFFPRQHIYAGAGLQLAYNRYTKRHNVDDNGFLDESYKDKSKLQQSLLLHLFYELPIKTPWTGGLKLEQNIPINDDITETSLSFVVLF